MRVCVTGAGGFIGYHLTNYLKEHGHWVRGVDIKRPKFAPTQADEFWWPTDLRDWEDARDVTGGIDWVFGLAADMGGMGYIGDPRNDATIMHDNTLINLNTLEAARHNGVARYLFTSSACVYPVYRQNETDVQPLAEGDAFPAQPQDPYGWEKLYFELVCGCYPVDTRIVRLHNVYGPLGAWNGGREKAPAALCRKIAEAKSSGDPRIPIWGDGQQTRSFMYIDDCLRGLLTLMESDYTQPINLGSDRLVSVDGLADMIAAIAGVEIVKVHVAGPQGVRGRNADISRAREVLGWEPLVTLEDGLARTYAWIEEQVRETPG